MKTKRSVRKAIWTAIGNLYLLVFAAVVAGPAAAMACLFAVPIVAFVMSVRLWLVERGHHRQFAFDPHPIELDENPIAVSCLYQVTKQGSWPRMGLPVALLRLVQVGYARFTYDEGELTVELEDGAVPMDELDVEALHIFQKLALGGSRFSMSDIAEFAQEQREHYAALCRSWVTAVKSSLDFYSFGFSLQRSSRASCLVALVPDIVLSVLIVSMALDVSSDDARIVGLSGLVIAICAVASIFWCLGRSASFDVLKRGRRALAECEAYVVWLQSDDAKGELAAMDLERLRELQLWTVALGVAEGAEFPEPEVFPDARAGVGALAVDTVPRFVSHSLFTHEQHSEIDEAFSEANELALGDSDGFSSSADAGGFGGDGGSGGGDGGGDGGGCGGGCGGCCGGCGGD